MILVINVKFKNLLIIIFSVFMLFTACMNESSGENISDTTALPQTTLQEKTTIPPAQGLDAEELTSDATGVSTAAPGMCIYGEYTGTDKTATGLEPLPLREFVLSNADSLFSKSDKSVSHSYGVAKDEKPHNISIENQHYFNEKALDAVCYDDKTAEKILYLTFDCGYENGYTSKILDVLKEKQIPAAFFCTLPQVKDNKELIARMINEGHIVGNHSVNHPDFSGLSTEKIIEEVKGFDDYIRQNFGYSSCYFRYPEGKYSEKSTAVLNNLGFKCIFWSLAYADWNIENQKGASYACETVLSRLHPGAVILLHSVSPDNANALGDIIDAATERGYTFRALSELS